MGEYGTAMWLAAYLVSTFDCFDCHIILREALTKKCHFAVSQPVVVAPQKNYIKLMGLGLKVKQLKRPMGGGQGMVYGVW